MGNTDRVDKDMFVDEHYLGKPADMTDRLTSRRIRLVESIEGFIGTDLTLVEVGCGNGATSLLLADRFKSCSSIDINDDHVEEFNSMKQQLAIDNCSFSVLDVEQDPLPDSFDRLISFEVIEHLRDDTNVSAYFDLLKPGGMAVISVPNKWWIFETHGASLPLLPWNRVPFFSWLPRPIHEKYAHARIYTRPRIRKLMEDAGFDILDVQLITAPLDVLSDGVIKRIFTSTIFRNDTTRVPFLSTSIFMVLRKPQE